MNSRVEHWLYTIFKRNIGTTVTVALILTVASYFLAPAIALGFGVVTGALCVWWIVFIING